MLRSLWIALVVVFAGGVAHADAPRAQFHLERGTRANVDIPFELDLIVEGFDKDPEPAQPKLELPNATVTPLGAEPNVSQMTQIINGRRRDFERVQWVFRWSIEAHKAGQLRIPNTTVTQDSNRATATGGGIEVAAVPTTDQMKIQLAVPTRPVFVGETVPVALTWLFRQEPVDYTITLPILGTDAFTVTAPAPAPGQQKMIVIKGGTKELKIGYVIDRVTANGVEFIRLSSTLLLAPRAIGKVDVPPASVVAELPVGPRDFFGNAETRRFRAVDTARTVEVKALPESNRPATFAGAVGDQFAIEVRTSRSVVQLGEPVELDVKIKSNQSLETLSLGKLDGDGRLPKDKFTVPPDPPTGELSDDGKTKTFKVIAQVTGPATEIPALAFSYFNPTSNTYQTIRSEPIALSVKGGSFVGAGDVVAAKPTSKAASTAPADDSVLVNADLALSSMGAVNDTPLSGAPLWALVALLYAVPLGLLMLRSWQVRTRGQREEAAEVRAAARRVEELLDRAGASPAREIAGPLGSALRELARALGRQVDDGGLLARLETEGFAPSASTTPLSADLRSDAAGLLRRWRGEGRRRAATRPAAAIVLLALGGLAHRADASPLDDGRAAYQQAMQLTDNATARKAAFTRAQVALGEAVQSAPDHSELLTDWGNAALGAGDLATATLAYRRALLVDGANQRARHNLAWLRAQQPERFRPPAAGATDTLLFFHSWPLAKKLVTGGIAFAIGVLLLVPWSGRRKRGLGALAVLPLAIWLAMIASVILQDDHEADAIVMTDAVMRAADSAGAPATLAQSGQGGSLPRGAEVTVLEQREAWTRIQIASGTSGWVPQGSVVRVAD
ncbi:MAG: hypothetical protein AB7P03_01660 [Kofleriaceae bacterium]